MSCLGANHIAERFHEQGRRYTADADVAAYAMFELQGGIVAQCDSSWCTRVRRDDLLTIQVDGTQGSAVAGLTRCLVQSAATTPRPVWNPDAGLTPDRAMSSISSLPRFWKNRVPLSKSPTSMCQLLLTFGMWPSTNSS